MQKAILAVVMSAFLFMGATCGSTDISTLIAQVQATTTKACAFVATAETIAAIFAAGNPELQSAAAIAKSICDAVKPAAPTGRLDQVVAVAGVPIVGHFVRQQ